MTRAPSRAASALSGAALPLSIEASWSQSRAAGFHLIDTARNARGIIHTVAGLTATVCTIWWSATQRLERNAKRAAERGNMLNGCSGISSLCAEIRSNLCGPFAKLFGQQLDIIYGTPRQSNARDSPSAFTLADAPRPPLTLAQEWSHRCASHDACLCFLSLHSASDLTRTYVRRAALSYG